MKRIFIWFTCLIALVVTAQRMEVAVAQHSSEGREASVTTIDSLVSDPDSIHIQKIGRNGNGEPLPSVRVTVRAGIYLEWQEPNIGIIEVKLSEPFTNQVAVTLVVSPTNSPVNGAVQLESDTVIFDVAETIKEIRFSTLDGTDVSKMHGFTITPVVTTPVAAEFYTVCFADTLHIINEDPYFDTVGPVESGVTIGESQQFFWSISDVAADLETMRVQWDWGDNTSDTLINAPHGSISHTYAFAGRYSVGVTAIDKDGGIGFMRFLFVVRPVASWIELFKPVAIGKTEAVLEQFGVYHGNTQIMQLGGVGHLSDGEMAGIEINVVGSGVLSFDWQVLSEGYGDILSFYQVGSGPTNQLSYAMSAGWESVARVITSANNEVHTLRWEYEKGQWEGYAGSDCGWISAIKWTPTYTLIINEGSGSGVYTNGTEVIITANTPPEYREFDCWVGDAVEHIQDRYAATTTLTMPNYATSIEATYCPSIARITGSYGRKYIQFGSADGVSADFAADSPSGTPALRFGGAGIIPDNDFAAIETTVSGSGSIIFNWRACSEHNGDCLRFLVDGELVNQISGTKVPWTTVSNRIDSLDFKYHVLRWEYLKDGSFASSSDSGWVDDIVWIADNQMPSLQPHISNISMQGHVPTIEFMGERGIIYNLYSNTALNDKGWVLVEDVNFDVVAEINGVHKIAVQTEGRTESPRGFYKIVAETCGGDPPTTGLLAY